MTKKQVIVWVTACYTSLITMLSLIKISVPTPELNVIGFDKIIHFGIYFVLNTLFISIVIAYKNGIKATQAALSTTAAVAYGVIIEVIQGYVGRDFDFFDMAANTIGAVAAVTLLGNHRLRRMYEKILC